MAAWWQNRTLTISDEDSLTDAVIDALASDERFRAAYEEIVLAPLSAPATPHIIGRPRPRVSFAGYRSHPDMVLDLDNSKQVACEHKIRAPETVSSSADGRISKQLERYLAIPNADAVAYFRPTWREPPADILFHPRYLHPVGAPHYLWRHLYPALLEGSEPITVWLRQNFDGLGFTPARAHVGPLVEQTDMENFGKLWDALTAYLFDDWRREHGTHSTLFLTPRTPSDFEYVMLVPKANNGTELRTRVRLLADDQSDATLTMLWERLALVLPALPVRTVMTTDNTSGRRVIDLHTPLCPLLDGVQEVAGQEARLLAHVLPIAEALGSKVGGGDLG